MAVVMVTEELSEAGARGQCQMLPHLPFLFQVELCSGQGLCTGAAHRAVTPISGVPLSVPVLKAAPCLGPSWTPAVLGEAPWMCTRGQPLLGPGGVCRAP